MLDELSIGYSIQTMCHALKHNHKILISLFQSRYQSSLQTALVRQSWPIGVQPWLQVNPRIQYRRAKSSATKKLDELLPRAHDSKVPPEDGQDDGPSYPAVVQQACNNMQKFQDCVVLTRVGSFYEVCVSSYLLSPYKTDGDIQLYLDHADTYGPLLNLKVAKKKTTAGPVSMVDPQMFPPINRC